MNFALVNPNWTFEKSVYFGCREPHLPLEFGYAKALLEEKGHSARIIDAHFWDMTFDELSRKVTACHPDYTIITTAPNYLFWRCPPPELRIPLRTVEFLRKAGGILVAVGPHGSVTPYPVLSKLEVDLVIAGEFEQVLVKLAEEGPSGHYAIIGRESKSTVNAPRPASANLESLPPLTWPEHWIKHHTHHHHRFDAPALGPGGELEASRGCPFNCTFCAKESFRTRYRQRSRSAVITELDRLIEQGVEYVYFIDELFLPDRALLEALCGRPVIFGIQTRIDIWNEHELELLGRAGCVSVEAGVESISPEGRQRLNKKCRHSTAQLTGLLIAAKRFIPFVQANLIRTTDDDSSETESWRRMLRTNGVWANDPVPVFLYPGSPAYRMRWGQPDEYAWERAHADYLLSYGHFSELQEELPLPLSELETLVRKETA